MTHEMAWSTLSWEVGFTVLFKASLLVALAWLLARLVSRGSAACRHAIWTAALGAFVVVLGAQVAVDPTWGFVDASFETSRGEAPVQSSLPVESSGKALVTAGGSAGTIPGPRVQSSVAGTDSVWDSFEKLCFPIWLIGVAFVLFRFVRALVSIQRITASARLHSEARSLVSGLETDPVARTPVLVSDRIQVPMTWGWLRPVILVPRSSGEWSASRWEAVLLHELSHIRRRDYATHLLRVVACALGWPNPLVWWAARCAVRDQERACDDRVVSRGMDRVEYAGHLFSLAERMTDAEARCAMGMGSPCIRERIRALLLPGTNRRRTSRTMVLALAVLAVSSGVPLAMIGLVAPRPTQASVVRSPVEVDDRIASLVRGLDDEDPLVRQKSAWSLAELETPAAVDPLIERLHDEDAAVRAVAAWALGEIKVPRSIPPLTRILHDRDPSVREMAVRALGEMESAAAISPLLSALEDGRGDVRRAAVWALGEVRDPRAEEAVRRVLSDSPEPALRLEAARALTTRARNSHAANLALDELIRGLADPDPAVRRVVVRHLGTIGVEEAVPDLIPLLRDPDPETRDLVVWALDEINPSRTVRTVSVAR